MRYVRGSVRRMLLFVAAGLCAIAAGCAGPSTRVLPRQLYEMVPETQEVYIEQESANLFYIDEVVRRLAGQAREAGGAGEAMTADYLKQLFADYGYEAEVSGSNVSAVLRTENPESDIVIVTANHGLSVSGPGANDNASGVAVLVETARLLADVGASSDTELRFASFSGSGSGTSGAKAYEKFLTSEECRRVIGVISLGPLGYLGDEELVLGTEDGNPTFLGDQLLAASAHVPNMHCLYEQREGGPASVFARRQLPAVRLSQGQEAYERGTVLERPELLDLERLAQTAELLTRVLSDLMSTETPSMIAKSHHYNVFHDEAYTQKKDAALPFGQVRAALEERTGQTGRLFSQNIDNDGLSIESYRYLMKWFEVDQILQSDYYFKDGKLMLVNVRADEAGVDTEDMHERISSVYGAPYAASEGPNGVEYHWADYVHRIDFGMIPDPDGYDLEIREYDTPRTLLDGWQVISADDDNPQLGLGARDASGAENAAVSTGELIAEVRRLLPMENTINVNHISIYTDGIGKTVTGLTVTESEDEAVPVFGWEIDLYDAIDEEGRWRNRTETRRQLLRMYGDMLAAAEPERYKAAFEERFAGQEAFSSSVLPDFSESFQWFVLEESPPDALPGWGDRIRFFYEFEELTAYRDRVRTTMLLPDKEEIVVGEAPGTHNNQP